MTTHPSRSRSSVTDTVLFALSCAAVMVHFVFSRVFRDSLLGNDLPVQKLPLLILIGTGVALALSVSLSWLLRRGGLGRVIRLAYLTMAACEMFLAFVHWPVQFASEVFYVLVSASTAIGVSLLWLLVSNWISSEPDRKAHLVPMLLVSGTAGGLLAGVGLVHLRSAESFAGANLFLASMNIFTACLLSFHRERIPVNDIDVRDPRVHHKVKRARVVAISLAAATVLSATGSTLLDLTYRITAAHQYTSRTALLHFFGYLQAGLALAAVMAQLGLARCKPCMQSKSSMAMYAIFGSAVAVLTALVPSFVLLTAVRTGEYAARNSLFRFGAEMTYAELPNQLRREVRPIIDVVGERVGDSIAAGLLQALFWLAHGVLPLRVILICLSMICIVLWKICDRIAIYTHTRRMAAGPEPSNEANLLVFTPAEESEIG
jgi:ATP/ADP translocase